MKIYQLFNQKVQSCLQVADITEQLKKFECTEDYRCIIQSLVNEAMVDLYEWATTTKLPNDMNLHVVDLISKTVDKQLELDSDAFEMYFTPSTITMPYSNQTNLRLETPLKSVAYEVMREVTGYDVILTIHPYYPAAVKFNFFTDEDKIEKERKLFIQDAIIDLFNSNKDSKKIVKKDDQSNFVFQTKMWGK